jgi:tRNA threonylcarbamoyladenosine biosynthesis protein TsaB
MGMLVLAIETATESAGVALANEEGVLAVVSVPGRRHAEVIAPGIAFVCERVGIRPGNIDAVAVDVGPGLFTGLRVGVASAQGLGFSVGIGVVEATSLEILANGVVSTGVDLMERQVLAVVDARRGEVFSARFCVAGDELLADGPPQLDAPEALAERLDTMGPVLAVGGGALRYADILAAGGDVKIGGVAFAYPPVEDLARIGVRRALAGEVLSPGEVAPRYLREAEARINWEQRHAPPMPSVSVPAGNAS